MNEAELKAFFGDIELSRAKNFDPIRFAYIKSLANRSMTELNRSNSSIAEKLLTAVATFQADFKQAEESASDELEKISTEFSNDHQSAKEYFEQGCFKQLSNMHKQLRRQHSSDNKVTLLNELSGLVNINNNAANQNDELNSFDDILNKQERELISGVEQDQQELQKEVPKELQSMKAFRESMKYFNIDKVIEHAINDLPANPGPHNPHMLAIKSLTQMHELSPQYLRRFAAYIETLLWLEKNANKLSDVKKAF